MPFKIRTFKKANTDEDVKTYADGIQDILSRLEKRLELNAETFYKTKPEIINELTKIQTDLQIFDRLPDEKDRLPEQKALFRKANIQMHPRLWSMSDRVGKSDITIYGDQAIQVEDSSVEDRDFRKEIEEESPEEEIEEKIPEKDPTFYEEIKFSLMSRLKKLKWFDPDDQKAKEEINIALNELDQWHTDAASAYAKRLLNATVESLCQKLENLPLDAEKITEKNNLVARLNAVKALHPSHLETSTESLEQTKKINQLRNDVITFNEKLKAENKLKYENKKLEEEKKLNELNALAAQMSVVGKIWIDPYYSNPKKLNYFERARQILKWVAFTIGAVSAIGAFISVFVFPPAALILAPISAIGLYPAADDFLEVARNFYYGRSPTKKQVTEIGIATPTIAGLNFGAHAIPAIGAKLIHHAPKIANAMINIGTFIGTKLMNGVCSVANTLGSFLNGFHIKKSNQAKVESKLYDTNNAVTDFKTMTQLLRNEEADLPGKKQVMIAQDKLSSKLKKEPGLFYMFKDKNGKYNYEKSWTKEISEWDKGHFSLFSSSKAKQIKKSAENYFKLATTDLQSKLNRLNDIDRDIQLWKNEIIDGNQSMDFGQPLNKGSKQEIDQIKSMEQREEKKPVVDDGHIKKRSSSRLAYVRKLEHLIDREKESLEKISKQQTEKVYQFRYK